MQGDRQRKWDIEQDCSTSSPKLIDSFLTGPSSIDRGVSSCRAVAYTDAHTALLQCSADTQCIILKESRWLWILRRFIDGGALNLTFPKIYCGSFSMWGEVPSSPWPIASTGVHPLKLVYFHEGLFNMLLKARVLWAKDLRDLEILKKRDEMRKTGHQRRWSDRGVGAEDE